MAKRIFERLRDEHGYGGGYTVVEDHVRRHWVRGREVFVPLAHPPGHAQVDFGEAVAVIGGETTADANGRGRSQAWSDTTCSRIGSAGRERAATRAR